MQLYANVYRESESGEQKQSFPSKTKVEKGKVEVL